jgi:hypothetical protein
MIYEQFINVLRRDMPVIAEKFARGVSTSEFTRTYRKMSEKELIKIGMRVYDNLGQWLATDASPADIGKIYARVGVERYEQGFPLCELSYAIHFVKKVFLNHIFSEGFLPDTLKLYQTHDFVARVHDFFDLAAFYLIRGFQESLYKRIISQKSMDKKTVAKAFPEGSFYYEREPDFRTFEKALEGFNLFKVK